MRKLLATTVLLSAIALPAHGFAVPPSARVIKCTAPATNPVGDDDAPLIQKCLSDAAFASPFGGQGQGRYGAPTPVWLANGTYNIRSTIETKDPTRGWSTNPSGWFSGSHLVGESRVGVVLKLADNLPAFVGGSNKGVIKTGSENPTNDTIGSGNQSFDNIIEDLTIDLGAGNFGAVGVEWLNSNWGAIRNVKIVAPVNANPSLTASVGIFVNRPEYGMSAIDNVEVVGARYGAYINGFDYIHTFNRVSFRDQSTNGIWTQDNNITVFGDFFGTAPAIKLAGGNSSAALRIFQYAGVLGSRPAGVPVVDSINNGRLLINEVNSNPVGVLINTPTGTSQDGSVVASPVDFPSGAANPYSIWTGADFVQINYSLPNVSVEAYGATPGNDADDDRPAFSAAIAAADSQYPNGYNLYMPGGSYRFDTTLDVPATTKMRGFWGTGVNITRSSMVPTPLIIFLGANNGNTTPLTIKGVNSSIGAPDAISESLHYTDWKIETQRPVYMIDVRSKGYIERFTPQSGGGYQSMLMQNIQAPIRQSGQGSLFIQMLNCEFRRDCFIAYGSTTNPPDIAIAGYKTERSGTYGTTAMIAGNARVSIVGAVHNPIGQTAQEDLYKFINAPALAQFRLGGTGSYQTWVRQKVSGVTTVFPQNSFATGGGSAYGLYRRY